MIDVAIDARWAQGARRGAIGRGLLSLVPRLAGLGQVLALVDGRRDALEWEVPTRSLRLPIQAPSSVWLDVCVPFALRRFKGVFHSPFYFLPAVCPCPTVVTLHDISFETHRHLFTGLRGALFRARGRMAARKADRIVTVSQWTKEQLIEVYGVTPDRIALVQNGVEADFRPLAEDEVPAWRTLLSSLGVGTDYLVALGGARRRRADRAAAAWRLLRARGLPHDLVIVGEAGSEEDGLTFVPNAGDATLRSLLAGATLFLYPTEMEGFGLPALEAAACGTPSVCSPVAALPEVLGDTAVWCEPSGEGMADAAESVLLDHARLDDLSRAAAELPGRWTWDGAAIQLARAYDEAWTDRKQKR